MSTVQTKQTNLREKLAELLDFRKMRDRLSGLGLYIGKDRTGTDENLLVRGGANVDDLQIGEIAALVGGTAVDVFVYDTSRDSDGGKWRERTQHTSWYNEELNTATRGGRREFPAVAVIVAEANKVTIYDGDDPDLSMWMVFDLNGTASWGTSNMLWTESDHTAVTALNGMIVTTNSGNSGIQTAEFITDQGYIGGTSSSLNGFYGGSIAQRNDGLGVLGGAPRENYLILNNYANDVAMTVLPNAPIDQNTGLPVPTIAVATDGGVSVIKDDGKTVVNSDETNKVRTIHFNNQGLLLSTLVDFDNVRAYELGNSLVKAHDYYVGSSIGFWHLADAHNSTYSSIITENASSNILGLTKFNFTSTSKDSMCYITSKYNTGWMPGDIKLATLSDTKIEKVGVDETTELVTNGHFTTDTTGWSSIRTDLSIESEKLKITIDDGVSDNGSAYQELNLIGGKKYTVSGYIENGNAVNIDVLVTNGINYITDSIAITSGSLDFTFDFIADYNLNRLVVRVEESAVGQYAYADNISVKQTGELITNGTFDDGTVGWLYADNGTSSQSVSSGVLTLSHTTYTNSMLYQILDLIPGKKYVLTGQTGGTNFDLCNIRIGSSLGGNQFGNIVSSEATSSNLIDNVITFTPTQSTTYISLRINSSSPDLSCDFDNISVRLAEDDRSVNNNGLQIFGEITKSPVAPGADLVAYSGFSINNYLVQPYNEDLNFGTGDFSIMGWVNQPAGQTSYLLDRRSGANDGISMGINSDNLLSVSVRDGTSDSLGGVNFPTDSWAFVSFVRRDGIGYIYVNGTLLSQGNLDDDASENTPLVLGGISYTNIGYCAASLVLFRISATAPTDAQIAKIYRDEKALFQDGAQATLYGSSDAVTALAYDEKTELLHVGTSSGRSDFSGLRRINNTTTAITTSISAHNNLIAEQ